MGVLIKTKMWWKKDCHTHSRHRCRHDIHRFIAFAFNWHSRFKQAAILFRVSQGYTKKAAWSTWMLDDEVTDAFLDFPSGQMI